MHMDIYLMYYNSDKQPNGLIYNCLISKNVVTLLMYLDV